MKKSMKISISVLLVISLVFSTFLPTLASSEESFSTMDNIQEMPKKERALLEAAIADKNYSNLTELTTSQRKLISEITSDPNKYLSFAEVVDGHTVLIYNTDDVNVHISYTDGQIEIVERIDESTFLINGEKHVFKFEKVDEYKNESKEDVISPTSSWVELSHRPSGTFVSHSAGWHNIHAQNAFATYTVGTLATIIAFFVNPLVGVVVGVASMLISSQYSNTSVAKAYKVSYRHQDLPNIYRMESFHAYAVWQGRDYFLGVERKYYAWAPNL